MNPVSTQQIALDNALVAPEKRLKIEKCNARIEFSNPQREATYQVTLDTLKLSPCYLAFLITVKVPKIYMNQFWNTIKKIKDTDAYQFKLHKKKNAELTLKYFVKFSRSSGTMASVICFLQSIHIKCTSHGEHLLLSSIDFMFQADNRDISSTRKEHMPYPRFIKVIISHFISKDKTISMRYRINVHTIRDDSLLGTLKFVSKIEDSQMYGALILEEMINQDIKDSTAYKTYLAFATGTAPPKKSRKFKKVALPSKKLSPVLEDDPTKKPKQANKPAKKSTTVQTLGAVIRDTPSVFVLKKKATTKDDRSKGIDLLSDVVLLEVAQLKKALKKCKKDSHMLHASGSSKEVSSQPKVPDESPDKTTGTDKGTGTKPGVSDVP
ncbi:hypothetical protein Tco_0233193 [Tanacetum coccineum]